ncbi:MAG: hypothetical protein QM811_15105 [Pirellulales bacterium]
MIARLAQAYGKTDPKKAEILKQAFAASKQNGIAPRFEDLAQMLGEEQFGDAVKSQAQLQLDLAKLLELLQSGDQNKVREDERARLKEYIARINRLIKQQEGEIERTKGEGEAGEIASSEGKLAEKVAQLAKDIARTEGKNDGGKNENGKNDAGKNDSGKKDAGDSKSGDKKSGDAKSGG